MGVNDPPWRMSDEVTDGNSFTPHRLQEFIA